MNKRNTARCADCATPIRPPSARCRSCFEATQRRDQEPITIRGVVYRTYMEAAKALGVSDATIRDAHQHGPHRLNRIGLGWKGARGGGIAADAAEYRKPPRPRGWTEDEVAAARGRGTLAEARLVLATLGLLAGFPADPAARGMAG